jgi:hypothetical protein
VVEHFVEFDLERAVALARLGGYAAPVGVRKRQLAALHPLLLDSEAAGDNRATPIRPEHPAGMQLAAVVEHDAADGIVFGAGADQVHRPIAEQSLGALLQGGIDPGLVKGDAARHKTEIEAVDRRVAAGGLVAQPDEAVLDKSELVFGLQRVQHPELIKARQRVGIDQVCRDGCARKGVAVHHDDVPTSLGERVGQRRACAPCPHDDSVVLLHPISLQRRVLPSVHDGHQATGCRRDRGNACLLGSHTA